jgi:hypothetical protein
MKKTTSLLFIMLVVALFSITAQTPEACSADGTKVYYTTNAGWTNSEWYKIIDIDAELLGNAGLANHSGIDGQNTSTVFNSGTFTTPVYKWNDATKAYDLSGKNWPVNYYMACLAPTFYTSSRTKVDLATKVSGNGVADAPCYHNNNSVKTSPVWDKKGFIELSRQGSEVANTPPSRHGYLEINDLPQVERVQWTYSSTGWKRGVKLDIKHGDGPWEPLRWIPSDIAASLGGFAEQGYGFEEIIGKQEDATSKISLRWRIWEGDTTNVNLTKTDGSKYNVAMTPYGSKQVVRIHQIKVFSGVDAPEAPSAVKRVVADAIKIRLSNRNLVLSEMSTVDIYSYDGKKLVSATGDKIDVSSFSKGLYIIKAVGTSGITQKKIVL